MRFELLSPGAYLPREYWTRSVPGATRIEIEIGPGDGRFLIEAARREPSTVWVGLEARAGLSARVQARADRPPNVHVHHCDARWVIEHLVPDASIDAYHAYFPDPWWKKRHHKRRLFTLGFPAALRRTLKPYGCVYVLSDAEVVFDEAVVSLAEQGFRERAWQREAADPAQSSYERKYRRQGRRLFEACFVKEG